MARPVRVVVRAMRHGLRPVCCQAQRVTFLFFHENPRSNPQAGEAVFEIPQSERRPAVVDLSCCVFAASAHTADSGRLWTCLRRERTNDFLETRIAAQWIPDFI